MDQNPTPADVVEPPRGFLPARVDEKGRLKLPVAVQQYLASFGQEKVFITSLDTRIARIYPISVWKENEIFFEQASEDPDAAEDVAFIAAYLGADSEPDGQGRLLLPTDLRRTLNLENQQVWLSCYKGRINVFSKEIFEQRKQRALGGLDEKLRLLERRGFR
ncbi:MAG: hypothetical protein LC130_24050 [Bryobacterales bacterium]|nr:hypothetical protein [Bryobacterales bacterium]MEB2360932.1 hypothetical protein [Bryobacterales bacterium]